MKNISTLIFALICFFGMQSKAQVIADFETDISANLQAAWGSVTDPNAFAIVDNPSSSGLNTSAKCLKILQLESYKPWGNGDWYGINLTLDSDIPVDKTSEDHWLHFKYYCTTVGQQIKFEIYGDNRSDIGAGFIPVTKEADLGQWVEVVINLNFDTYNTAMIHNVFIMPNNTYQTNARTAEEITYIDDIEINNVPPAGYINLADFETDITANLVAAFGEIKDPNAFKIVDNPVFDNSSINTSSYCLKVLHKASYKPWGNSDWYGIVINLPAPVSVLRNSNFHYLHFKYYSQTIGAQIGIELYDPKVDLNSAIPAVSVTGKWIDATIDLRDITTLKDDKITKLYVCPNRRYQTDKNTLDQITYFDDFQINDIPPSTPPATVKAELLADFEVANDKMFVEDGITDPEAFEQTANPLKSVINNSDYCLKVVHKPEFKPWGSGDWFGVVIPFDPVINVDKTSAFHFLHYKYLADNPGATINIEFESPKISFNQPVEKIGEWIEVVIDLNTEIWKNKTIKLVKLNPNNQYQTNGSTENETVYFDDIKIDDNPNITSTKGIENTSKLKVYPNPATSSIFVENAINSKLMLYNTLGQQVIEQNITSNKQLVSLNTCIRGVYLMKIISQNGELTSQKIVIQ
jgi:hypothetical protein